MSQDINNKHSFTLENRSTLTLSGIEDVPGFDEETVNLETAMGNLVVKGEKLHITKLSLDTGDVMIEGKINAFQYLGSEKSNGILSRIFK